MAPLTPAESLARLRALFRDAFKCAPSSDAAVLEWARRPEHWATLQIQHHGWSFLACEAVVRQCRILSKRAQLAAAPQELDA
jgi:hypothetical protein